jgi:hypothetical protein
VIGGAAAVAAAPQTPPAQKERAGPALELATVPLAFEPNRGRAGRRIDFLARGDGYTLSLAKREAVLHLRGARRPGVRMRFPGVRTVRRPRAVGRLPGKVNYLVGARRDWRTGVPTYRAVRYRRLWPGIDLVWHGRRGALEYDFRVAAGADPARSVISFAGADEVRVDRGDLVLDVGGHELRQLRPHAYQSVDGERRTVKSRYALLGDRRVGIRLGGYDRSRAVVIDPVILTSTYLGGTGEDLAEDVEVDAAGNTYVIGETSSADFPTASPFQAMRAGTNPDAFVTKFDQSGALVYSTYLGGGGGETGRAIEVDAGGNAHVGGNTGSADFPTANPIQPTKGAGVDGFVTKLSPSGTLESSTFLGGNGSDFVQGLALDGNGIVYLTGGTASTDFPVVNPIQAMNGGMNDMWVASVNAAGTALAYSTYLGGSANDSGVGIAVDSAGAAAVVGETGSTNFPTANAIQAMNGGGTDAFVTKVNAAGNALVYSTYLGGTVSEFGVEIALDGAGNAHVTGETDSSNFPTANALQPTPGGGFADAFATKLNADGSAFVYSTYLGGGGDEIGRGVGVDAGGNAYFAGQTSSEDFPTSNAAQAMNRGGRDAFVTKYNPSGGAHEYSTYLGGTAADAAHGLTVDGAGNAYVVGDTASGNFPVNDAFQPQTGGATDAFLAKLGEPPPPDPPPDPPPPDPDLTAPVIQASVDPRVFAVDRRGRAETPIAETAGRPKAPRGTRFRYTLSEPAQVVFTIQRRAAGRRVKGRCVRPTRRNRKRRRCTRFVQRRAFAVDGVPGDNTKRFRGRIGKRSLRPARYRATLVAIDAALNRSAAERLGFRVVRRR